MTAIPTAEDLVRTGDPVQALKLLQDQVRSEPGNARPRVFLFQLLCVLGQWDRALAQLDVLAKLDASTLPMVETYREAIRCELLRDEVFGGRKTPMVFGQPDAWLALLIEALLRHGRGEPAEGSRLRELAFEQAPMSAGVLKTGSQGRDDPGVPFAWIADADSRLGPVLEAIVNGKYYWIPFARLSEIRIVAPADLRDSVWMPGHLLFANGGESVALIPTRYPGSAGNPDPRVALSRATLWQELGPETFAGQGQRMLTTDAGDFPLMDLRSIELEAAEVPADSPATE